VSAARAAGYSWGKIAGSLGVSPQAAHEHYRHVR
jgi:predicted DNA binding protein